MEVVNFDVDRRRPGKLTLSRLICWHLRLELLEVVDWLEKFLGRVEMEYSVHTCIHTYTYVHNHIHTHKETVTTHVSS